MRAIQTGNFAIVSGSHRFLSASLSGMWQGKSKGSLPCSFANGGKLLRRRISKTMREGRSKNMAVKKTEASNQESPRALSDDQIVTKRKLPRRSFLTAAGTILAGGAVAMVSGGRAAAQETTPEKKDDDADKKKETSKKSGTKTKTKAKTKKGAKSDDDADKKKPAQ